MIGFRVPGLAFVLAFAILGVGTAGRASAQSSGFYKTFCYGSGARGSVGVDCPCDNTVPNGTVAGCKNSTGQGAARSSPTKTTSDIPNMTPIAHAFMLFMKEFSKIDNRRSSLGRTNLEKVSPIHQEYQVSGGGGVAAERHWASRCAILTS